MLFHIIHSHDPKTGVANQAYLYEPEHPKPGPYVLFYFDDQNVKHRIGKVHILVQNSDPQVSPSLTENFEFVPQEAYSLGDSDEFYRNMLSLDSKAREEILEGLRDIAFDLKLFDEIFLSRDRFLLSYDFQDVRERLHHIAKGHADQTRYHFTYRFPSEVHCPNEMSFKVSPRAKPPTNIHALIGSNGTGKTRCLHSMALAAIGAKSAQDAGTFRFVNDNRTNNPIGDFANVVFSSFSAFDRRTHSAESNENYERIGLPNTGAEQELFEQLTKEFSDSLARIGDKSETWCRVLAELCSDPLFEEIDLKKLANFSAPEHSDRSAEVFQNLSSGHKIVLLTITKLVELVQDQTLVLIDEPETHLHPPLLSAFIRSLSVLLGERNGVAIVASHSPVLLQEIPARCVWIIHRTGSVTRVRRPTIETFGENVGTLTREIFGHEVTKSGYHNILKEAVTYENYDYETFNNYFDGQLGGEARALLRVLVQDRDENQKKGS